MVVISTQNWSILGKFAKKFQRNRLFFTDCFSAKFAVEISHEIGRFSCEFASKKPSKFNFFPLKSHETSRFFHEFWLFPPKIQWNRPIFPWILTFRPLKILRNRPIFLRFDPEIPMKFNFFFRDLSEALPGATNFGCCWRKLSFPKTLNLSAFIRNYTNVLGLLYSPILSFSTTRIHWFSCWASNFLKLTCPISKVLKKSFRN